MNHGVRRREVEVADSSELLLNDKQAERSLWHRPVLACSRRHLYKYLTTNRLDASISSPLLSNYRQQTRRHVQVLDWLTRLVTGSRMRRAYNWMTPRRHRQTPCLRQRYLLFGYSPIARTFWRPISARLRHISMNVKCPCNVLAS